MNLDVINLGQVFTPPHIVSDMLNLIQSSTKLENPRFLEPSCGNGAFFENLPNNKIGIELDSKLICDKSILKVDFFSYPVSEKFDCIIGNPPYVRYQDILDSTKFLLSAYKNIFDSRSNLYLFFIYKCILHLKDKGELIFITPRDFLKNTASIKLNEFLFSQGSITDFIDLGDKRIFNKAQLNERKAYSPNGCKAYSPNERKAYSPNGCKAYSPNERKAYSPNCAIWRFEKGNFRRKTQCLREFSCINGQIFFTKKSYNIPFSSLFFVKVGAVSGADSIFVNKQLGNVEFVNSTTAKSGKTKKMIYGIYAKDCVYLQKFKQRLIQRRIKKFNENNWWQWGRDYYKSKQPRIYVNTKTRNKKPFFIHHCNAYDGSILAIFPKFEVNSRILQELCTRLNDIDWVELGFVCNGRFLFSQRSLENCMIDSSFSDIYSLIFTSNKAINRVESTACMVETNTSKSIIN